MWLGFRLWKFRVWDKSVEKVCSLWLAKQKEDESNVIHKLSIVVISCCSVSSALSLRWWINVCNNFLLVHIRLRNHNSLELCIHPLHPYLRRILAVKVICCRLTPKTSIHSHVIDVYIACVWLASCLVVSLYHFYWLKTNCLLRNAIFIMCFWYRKWFVVFLLHFSGAWRSFHRNPPNSRYT